MGRLIRGIIQAVTETAKGEDENQATHAGGSRDTPHEDPNTAHENTDPKHNPAAVSRGDDEDPNISENFLQQQVSLLLEGKLGGILTWVPFILVIAIAPVHPLLALWLAFGVSSVLMVLEFYHGSYKPQYARFYWLTVAPWITYLVLGIIFIVDPFPWGLISNIVVSSMFLAVLVSLLVKHPFTMQHAREKVSAEVAATPQFYKLNVYLTSFWLVLFGIMMISSWAAYPLPDDSTGSLILGTIIPIVVPIVGIKLMPTVVAYLREKGANEAAEAPSPPV